MATDFIAKVKLDTGEVGRIGDVGKTVIRKLEPDTTEDQMEYNFFYATDVVESDAPASIGEISNIQVEPSFNDETDVINEGDSIVYSTGDLL